MKILSVILTLIFIIFCMYKIDLIMYICVFIGQKIAIIYFMAGALMMSGVIIGTIVASIFGL